MSGQQQKSSYDTLGNSHNFLRHLENGMAMIIFPLLSQRPWSSILKTLLSDVRLSKRGTSRLQDTVVYHQSPRNCNRRPILVRISSRYYGEGPDPDKHSDSYKVYNLQSYPLQEIHSLFLLGQSTMKFQLVAFVASLAFVAQVLALPQDSTHVIHCEHFSSHPFQCFLNNGKQAVVHM